jgi:hypothetical protein
MDVLIQTNASARQANIHPMKLKTWLLTALLVVVYVLHQDFWNWKEAYPLIFGFLPIGLAYQAGYSILAAAMMAILVRTAWPKHLENVEPEAREPKGDRL